jgi:hypothetical protein
VANDRTVLAEGRSWQGSGGRSTGDQWYFACAEVRLPMVRLAAGIRATDNDLQSVCKMGTAERVGKLFREPADRGRSTQSEMIDSTHIKAHRSASGAHIARPAGKWFVSFGLSLAVGPDGDPRP